MFSLIFSLTGSVGDALNELLHSTGAVLPHLGGDMGIHVQGEIGGGVAQVLLHSLDIIPVPDGHRGVGVPLWHNKDKSENPCVATG